MPKSTKGRTIAWVVLLLCLISSVIIEGIHSSILTEAEYQSYMSNACPSKPLDSSSWVAEELLLFDSILKGESNISIFYPVVADSPSAIIPDQPPADSSPQSSSPPPTYSFLGMSIPKPSSSQAVAAEASSSPSAEGSAIPQTSSPPPTSSETPLSPIGTIVPKVKGGAVVSNQPAPAPKSTTKPTTSAPSATPMNFDQNLKSLIDEMKNLDNKKANTNVEDKLKELISELTGKSKNKVTTADVSTAIRCKSACPTRYEKKVCIRNKNDNSTSILRLADFATIGSIVDVNSIAIGVSVGIAGLLILLITGLAIVGAVCYAKRKRNNFFSLYESKNLQSLMDSAAVDESIINQDLGEDEIEDDDDDQPLGGLDLGEEDYVDGDLDY